MTDDTPCSQARDGPVQFEKDTSDPFGIDGMIAEVTGGSTQKRYGIQEAEGAKERGSKRARVDDDDDHDRGR